MTERPSGEAVPIPADQVDYLIATAAAGRRQDLDQVARAEVGRWSRGAGSPARDGIPAQALPATAARDPGRLPQRDFDLGRGLGLLATGGPPATTAVLLTGTDGRADWLRAGQALHRLLAHAASRWVFASLHTQPLEAAAIRSLIQARPETWCCCTIRRPLGWPRRWRRPAPCATPS
jgi:hypothetical protein